jgi:hypothetical protein
MNNYTPEQVIKLAEYLGEKVIKVEWQGKVCLIYDSEYIEEYIEEIKPFVLDWNIIKQLEAKMKKELNVIETKLIELSGGVSLTYKNRKSVFEPLEQMAFLGTDEKSAILNAVLRHIEGRK